MTNEQLALLGAVTGVLGSGMAGLGLYLHWQMHQADRARLLITCVMGLIRASKYGTHPYICITMRNIGRRIVRIHAIWVKLPEKMEEKINTDGVQYTNLESRVNIYSTKNDDPIVLQEHEKREIKIDPFPNNFAQAFGNEELILQAEDSLGVIHEATFLPCHIPETISSSEE